VSVPTRAADGRPSPRPGAGRFLPVLFAALWLGGCTIFPQGAYWSMTARRPAAGGVAPKAEPERWDVVPATRGERAARWGRFQEAITLRWSNGDLAASARRMDGGAGRSVYADAVQTIVWFYVEPITYRQLLVAGLESLRAALDNERFRLRFPEAADGARRLAFDEALEILLLKARAADLSFAFQAADWLAAVMEKNRALLGLPDGAVVSEFLFGALDSLDPYSRYLTPEMLRVYQGQIAGAYAGIGAEMTERRGRFFVREAFEGGPAARAGLKPGDEIVAVDGLPVTGLALVELTDRIRGAPGTTVKVSVRAGGRGEPRQVTLTRAVVRLPAVRDAEVVDAERGIGYLRLLEFQVDAEAELRRAVERLTRQGAKGLILDLRDNPGGLLDEAVGVCGVFVPRGRLLETRGRMIGASQKYDVSWFQRPAWNGPLVVLVNEHTASAAEAVAAALLACDRAAVIGRRTFGKGAAQICFPIDWGTSAVCLTVARVYDGRGRCLDGYGVMPQRLVAGSEMPIESPRDDPVVRAAMEVIVTGEP
jgi:carboxyl-terminal processing protease